MGAVSIVRDVDHANRLHIKNETLKGLKALYEEWIPYREPDHPDMLRIQRRIKQTENQLKCMRP